MISDGVGWGLLVSACKRQGQRSHGFARGRKSEDMFILVDITLLSCSLTSVRCHLLHPLITTSLPKASPLSSLPHHPTPIGVLPSSHPRRAPSRHHRSPGGTPSLTHSQASPHSIPNPSKSSCPKMPSTAPSAMHCNALIKKKSKKRSIPTPSTLSPKPPFPLLCFASVRSGSV